MTIERLVVTFRAGEHRDEIFREIYRRYHRSVRIFFARSGFSADDARDLAQETFIRIWRGIAKFRGESKFGSWLYTIAANVGRNEVSRQTAGKRGGETVTFDDCAEDELLEGMNSVSRDLAEPLDELLTKEGAVVLRRHISGLPPRMLRILLLRLDQGLKLREIAVLEQISINTVKSQLGQAKARLRPCLASYLGKATPPDRRRRPDDHEDRNHSAFSHHSGLGCGSSTQSGCSSRQR